MTRLADAQYALQSTNLPSRERIVSIDECIVHVTWIKGMCLFYFHRFTDIHLVYIGLLQSLLHFWVIINENRKNYFFLYTCIIVLIVDWFMKIFNITD